MPKCGAQNVSAGNKLGSGVATKRNSRGRTFARRLLKDELKEEARLQCQWLRCSIGLHTREDGRSRLGNGTQALLHRQLMQLRQLGRSKQCKFKHARRAGSIFNYHISIITRSLPPSVECHTGSARCRPAQRGERSALSKLQR